ncbi:MAG: S9 family peptidase [Paludibacteraceae bacterium]|nr:S9 family peptidase [Paludibacteraceae bacterium]
MKRYIYIFLLVFSTIARADLLNDIIAGGYNSNSLPQITDMGDGEHYALRVGNTVLQYDYRSGAVSDTLFSADKTKITKLEAVDGFVLAPVERYMLVSANSQRIFRRSHKADWYIYDRQRGELKPLSAEMPVSEPVFSPNGKYIAFSRNNNIFIHKLDFSTEVAVTTDGEAGKIINGTPDWLYEEEFSTTCLYSFSPDSKQLAFVRLNESEVPAFSWQTYLNPESTPNAYPQNYSINYPRAGEKNAVPSVIVYDTYYKSLKTMQLPPLDDCYIPRISWTRAADQLAVFRLNRNQNKLEMFLLNSKSAVAKLVYSEENSKGNVDFEQIDEWQFFDDNTMLVVNESSGYRHAFIYSVNGQKLRQLTSGNYDVTRVYGYDPHTQTLFYQAALPTPLDRQLFVLNVKKNKTQCLTPDRGFNSAVWSADYKYLFAGRTSVDEPLSWQLLNREGRPLRHIVNNDSLKQKTVDACLPRKRFFSFSTERGDTLNGWIVLPPTLDSLLKQEELSTLNSQLSTKYPLLLYQYSGPASQQVLNRWKIDWEHYLAKEKNVVVACVDPRGTFARGREFRNLTYMNLGVKEAEDQISAANYLASLGFIDKDRMAIWGWSYGGFQTLMTMSQSASPFRCGIAVAPVTDFRLYDSAYTERFMRKPQSNESGYNSCALPLSADKLQGRVLLVHGVADDNVHCQNMWMYVDALVQAGKQFDMQIYPDDNHFLRKRSNYLHLYRRMTDFLENNLLVK